MQHKSIEIVMYVIYAYTIWIAAEYVWDWCKKWRNREKQGFAAQTPAEESIVRDNAPELNAHDKDQPSAA